MTGTCSARWKGHWPGHFHHVPTGMRAQRKSSVEHRAQPYHGISLVLHLLGLFQVIFWQMLSEMETGRGKQMSEKKGRWSNNVNLLIQVMLWLQYKLILLSNTHQIRRITTWMSSACLDVHILDWPATHQDLEKLTPSLAVRHTAQSGMSPS